MSLQWTLIATFLYVEIAVIFILLLPFVSPKMWQSFFRSKFCKAISSQGNIYFMVFIGILILFFFDSVREMYRYAQTRQADQDGHAHLDAEMQHNMKLFRAQRNFYIAGFALFLSFVIRRLGSLIITQASLQAQSEAAMKQALGARNAAQDLLKQKDQLEKGAGEAADNEGNVKCENLKGQIVKLEEQLALAIKDRDRAKQDAETMVTQSKNLTKEYDRLSEEHRKLEVEYKQLSGDTGSKKNE